MSAPGPELWSPRRPAVPLPFVPRSVRPRIIYERRRRRATLRLKERRTLPHSPRGRRRAGPKSRHHGAHGSDSSSPFAMALKTSCSSAFVGCTEPSSNCKSRASSISGAGAPFRRSPTHLAFFCGSSARAAFTLSLKKPSEQRSPWSRKQPANNTWRCSAGTRSGRPFCGRRCTRLLSVRWRGRRISSRGLVLRVPGLLEELAAHFVLCIALASKLSSTFERSNLCAEACYQASLWPSTAAARRLCVC